MALLLLPIWLLIFPFGIAVLLFIDGIVSLRKAKKSRYITEDGKRYLKNAKILKIIWIVLAILFIAFVLFLLGTALA